MHPLCTAAAQRAGAAVHACAAALACLPLLAQTPAAPAAPSPLPVAPGPGDAPATTQGTAWIGRWQGSATLGNGQRRRGEIQLVAGSGVLGGVLVADLERWPVQGAVRDDGALVLDVFAPTGRGRLTLEPAGAPQQAVGEARLAGVPGVVSFEVARTGAPPRSLTPLVAFVPPDRGHPRTIDRSSLAPATERAVETRVQAFLEERDPVGLTIAIGRIEEGTAEVTDVRGYGYADVRAGTRADAKTRYRWASISKPVSATIAHRLASAGTVDLSADVRELVPEFPAKRWPVTLRDILCHQSGITHYSGAVLTEAAYDSAFPFVDPVVALDRFKESPLKFEPGTKTSYSTHAWTLLAATLARAADKPFDALIQEHVAGPLSLETLAPDRIWEEVPHRTRGYHRCGQLVVQSVPDDISWKLAGGGLISTAGDLARFGLGLVDGQWLDAEAYARLTTRQATQDGTATQYGLGIRVGDQDGELTLSHSGSQNETATFLVVDPARKLAVAVMCNTYRTNVTDLGRSLLAILRRG